MRDHGDEPDYRFTLANERTYLAYVCTSVVEVASVRWFMSADIRQAQRCPPEATICSRYSGTSGDVELGDGLPQFRRRHGLNRSL